MKIVENENEVRITLDLHTIGYIARAKRDDKHAPSFTSQHAECIRPYGDLIGYSASVTVRQQEATCVEVGISST